MNKGFNKSKSKVNDNYNTSKEAFMLLKDYIPRDITIYDHFYCDGTSKKYMEEVYDTCKIIHEDKDAFTWFPECDAVITNPPFSKKFEVLAWLVAKEKPFACLLPMGTISTKKYRTIKEYNKFQYVVSNDRIKYEAKGSNGCATFESIWICSGLNLPRDIMVAI